VRSSSRVRDPAERPLVQALRRGDPAAFDAVYARYRGRVYAFLLRLSGRSDVADDLFQETWLKLARHARRLDEDTDVAAWLFTVARNAWRSHRRWSMLDVSRLVALEREGRATLAPASGPGGEVSVEARTDASRRVATLERALAELPPSSREVLLLVVVEGLAQDEAARAIGITYDALRQRLARARTQLAEQLETIEGKATR
jgi:RNA polymerase sigma-70 factor (ECF subfamily)